MKIRWALFSAAILIGFLPNSDIHPIQTSIRSTK
jgi:hypothetical protein